MAFDPDVHHRRSIRLRGYDYAAAGAYFVTICVQGRECRFGEIVDGAMRPNDAGAMVAAVWDGLPVHYAGVAIDAHVVMPNHFHGIIVLPVGAGPRACPGFPGPRACPGFPGPRACPGFPGPRACPEQGDVPGGWDLWGEGHPQGGAGFVAGIAGLGVGEGHPQGGAPTLAMGDVVHRFKSLTTARYRHGVTECGWPPFPGRLWQRNYYERVIRDEDELFAIRQYIRTNPNHWPTDAENPQGP